MRFCYIMRGVPGSGKSSSAHNIAMNYMNSAICNFWIYKYVVENNTLIAKYFGIRNNIPGESNILSAIHSTDEYFMEGNKYNFNADSLYYNHKRNFLSFCNSIDKGIQIVICDNTNIKRNDWIKYAKYAKENNYIISVVEMPNPIPEVAAQRNQHGVGVDTINKMISSRSPFDGNL
jgi:predicted kinase